MAKEWGQRPDYLEKDLPAIWRDRRNYYHRAVNAAVMNSNKMRPKKGGINLLDMGQAGIDLTNRLKGQNG